MCAQFTLEYYYELKKKKCTFYPEKKILGSEETCLISHAGRLEMHM